MEKHQPKFCAFCSKEFKVHNYRKKSAHFCGTDCYNQYRKNNAYPPKICPFCKTKFPINRKTRYCKYCSKKCSLLGRRKYEHREKTCPVCKKIFQFNSKNPRQIFCSNQCSVKNRAYKIDEKFFNQIDSEGKAYLLGLMFSDGNISSKNNYINFSSNDKNLVEIAKTLLGSNSPIHHYKSSFSLIIGNQNLHTALNKLGVLKRKSWQELSLPPIPKKLIGHFIRGLHDGDGCFYADNRQEKYSYLCSSLTCGSRQFLEQIKELLEKKLRISFHKVRFDRKENNKGSYQLCLSRKNDIKKFIKYLYQDCHYCLNRKYKITEQFYGKQI